MIRISKVLAAKIQLEAAIDAFNKNNIVVAITLAGACDGILNSLNKDNSVLEELKDEAVKLNVNLSREHVAAMLNSTRNALKHADRETNDIEIEREDAIFLLLRACTNYLRLNLDYSKVIMDYCAEYMSKVQ